MNDPFTLALVFVGGAGGSAIRQAAVMFVMKMGKGKPSGRLATAIIRNPIRKAPLTLMRKVPSGNSHALSHGGGRRESRIIKNKRTRYL